MDITTQGRKKTRGQVEDVRIQKKYEPVLCGRPKLTETTEVTVSITDRKNGGPGTWLTMTLEEARELGRRLLEF